MIEIQDGGEFDEKRIAEFSGVTFQIPQCPRCQVYTDDPEHWCGSVALVKAGDNPKYWRSVVDILNWLTLV